MPQLTPMDEHFVHQIPEPLPNVATPHEHWRESLFFVLHRGDRPGDVIILTLAHYPARQVMDSLQLGRVGGAPVMAHHSRPYDGDPHTMKVGPVGVEVVEPFRTLRLRVEDTPQAAVGLDLTFSARTRPHALRRGTMKAGQDVVWDQSHMVQSGTYDGTFTHQGVVHEVRGWLGQRDHSWGIRDHARCPLWIWLAVQIPEGMIAVWHWELPNGAHVYTDGCFAPRGDADPVPVVGFRHDLHWTDEAGNETGYGRDGDSVAGLAGRVELVLDGGRRIAVDAEGRWAQRYGPLGGGMSEMAVTTSDGSAGTAVYEVTGAHHHRYFPVARGTDLPPGG